MKTSLFSWSLILILSEFGLQVSDLPIFLFNIFFFLIHEINQVVFLNFQLFYLKIGSFELRFLFSYHFFFGFDLSKGFLTFLLLFFQIRKDTILDPIENRQKLVYRTYQLFQFRPSLKFKIVNARIFLNNKSHIINIPCYLFYPLIHSLTFLNLFFELLLFISDLLLEGPYQAPKSSRRFLVFKGLVWSIFRQDFLDF